MVSEIVNSQTNAVGNSKPPKPNQPVLNTIAFVESHLQAFARQKYIKEIENENGLTQKLSIFLSTKVKTETEFIFDKENMEDVARSNSPRVDLAVYLKESQKRIFAFEAKRLPAPEKARKKEYVVGRFDTKTGKYKESGGIERFKKNIHGQKLNFAGIIAYIQNGDFQDWHRQINNWIEEQAVQNPDFWSSTEKLGIQVSAAKEVAKYTSKHLRTDNILPEITVSHLWVKLNTK